MNRWHVYEWLKKQNKRGRLPNREAVHAQFSRLPWREVEEGILEFEDMSGRKVPSRGKSA